MSDASTSPANILIGAHAVLPDTSQLIKHPLHASRLFVLATFLTKWSTSDASMIAGYILIGEQHAVHRELFLNKLDGYEH